MPASVGLHSRGETAKSETLWRGGVLPLVWERKQSIINCRLLNYKMEDAVPYNENR